MIAGTYLFVLSDLLIDTEVISRSDQYALWVVGCRFEFFYHLCKLAVSAGGVDDFNLGSDTFFQLLESLLSEPPESRAQ